MLGIDADARALAEASRRAAHPRHGLPNACFVASGAEQLPGELAGIADRVTILFPWGSLLGGALGEDAAVATSLAGLVRVGGELELTLSVVGRDRVARLEGSAFGEAAIDRIRSVFGSLDLDLDDARRLTAAEIARLPSSWARRLVAGDRGRPVWRLTLIRRLARPLG